MDERNQSKSEEFLWNKLARFGVQRPLVSDLLYEQGNKLCHSCFGKKAVVIFDDEEFLHRNVRKFDCHVPGCVKSFSTLIEFEGHYESSHRHACSFCRKRLASSHLLDLHVSETHDSYFAAAAQRKPMFQCLLETCSMKFLNPGERRSHCIDVHKFPPDFRYDTADRKPKKVDPPPLNKTTPEKTKTTAPKMFSFGHGVSRGFTRSRPSRGQFWHQRGRADRGRTSENEVTMTELEDALPKVDQM